MAPFPSDFDIVSHYRKLIKSDESLTPPIAAIESLIAQLTSKPPATISETLSVLQDASDVLHKSVKNPISITAGTDLFQRYVVTTLQRPGALGPTGDFTLLRNHLINNSRVFVARAKEARYKIAENALPFLRSQRLRASPKKSTTVITYGPSRVISEILQHAASKSASPNLNVIYIRPSSAPSSHLSTQLDQQVSTLRRLHIPVATVASHATAHALSTLPRHSTNPLILCGASSVVANGGILSHLGTYQLALLARALKHKFYVACESYKVVGLYPLGQRDLPLVQEETVHFEPPATSVGGGEGVVAEKEEGAAAAAAAAGQADGNDGDDDAEPGAVDMTPPELITALITENGVMTPNSVSEELIKLWF